MPPMFLLGADEVFLPLSVGNFSRGASIEVPKGESLRVYTGSFDEEGEPSMKPLFEARVGTEQEKALVLLYHNPDGSIGHAIIDDSEAAHPRQSVRVLNVSPYPMTVVLGNERMEVPPEQQALAQPEADERGRFPFVYRSALAPGDVYTAPVKQLRFRNNNARLLILYTALKQAVEVDPEDPDREQYEVNEEPRYVPTAFRLYDQI